MLTMQNGEKFINDKYDDSKIQHVSKAIWYMMNSQYRSEYINELQITELVLQDSRSLGELETNIDEIISVSKNGERAYEFYDNVHMEIVFEVNLNRIQLRRKVYSLLDWVGDVGGLFEALTVISALLIGFYHYKTFEQYMAS